MLKILFKYFSKMELVLSQNLTVYQYSTLLLFIFLLSYILKDKYFLSKYRTFIGYSLCLDRIFLCIVCVILFYDRLQNEYTCTFYHDCFKGNNDTLLSDNYWFILKGTVCPSPYELVLSFQERYPLNGRTIMEDVPCGGSTGAIICPDSPYDCCYLSIHCDSSIKNNLDYSHYLDSPSNPEIVTYFGSINTHFTQTNVNGTNCPQYDDLILDFLRVEKEMCDFYFIFMIFFYILSFITQLCCFPSDTKKQKHVRLRGSA